MIGCYSGRWRCLAGLGQVALQTVKQSQATTWRFSSNNRSAIRGRRFGGSWWIPKTSTIDILQDNLPKCSLKNAKIDGIDMFNLKGVENRIYIHIFFSSITCRRLKIFHFKSSKILLWKDWKVNWVNNGLGLIYHIGWVRWWPIWDRVVGLSVVVQPRSDRRCSYYIWVSNSCIAYYGASYIKGLTPRGRVWVWVVLRLKTAGGVSLAAENWTPKDRGKNRIWGQKDWIL